MSTQDLPVPRPAAVIDAADESWDRVERVVEDALRWVRRGEVVDVLTTDRALHGRLDAWCAEHGHRLLAVDSTRETIRLRIGRGETTPLSKETR